MELSPRAGVSLIVTRKPPPASMPMRADNIHDIGPLTIVHLAGLELKSALPRRMLMRRAVLTTLSAVFVFAPTFALAHAGHDTGGLMHGFIHPIAGIDHVLAMVAVGVLAAQLGGRASWLVPLGFVGVMAVAGAIGMAGIQLPFSEVGIALSVIVLGLSVAFRLSPPVLAATALVGFFAVFHGHVHGAEIPAGASGIPYAAGFVGATAMLHAVGVGVGLLVGWEGGALSRRLVQAGGGAMALFGLVVLAA
jgi:urease accessory protein